MNRARVAQLLRELADELDADIDAPRAEESRPRAKRRPRLPVVLGGVRGRGRVVPNDAVPVHVSRPTKSRTTMTLTIGTRDPGDVLDEALVWLTANDRSKWDA